MTSPTQTLVQFAEQILRNKSLTLAAKQERYRLLMQLAKEANSRQPSPSPACPKCSDPGQSPCCDS